MPAWIAALLIPIAKAAITSLASAALPLALQILQRTGVINAAEAWGIKAGTRTIQVVQSIHTYDEYPGDPQPSKSTSNIDRG